MKNIYFVVDDVRMYVKNCYDVGQISVAEEIVGAIFAIETTYSCIEAMSFNDEDLENFKNRFETSLIIVTDPDGETIDVDKFLET